MPETVQHIDALGRAVEIPLHPQRIISLCPSQTETLMALGLGGRVVGRTHFCIHPAKALESVTAVGGTKQLKMERVHALAPDLVIAEKEENTREMVAELEGRYPVYVTDVKDWAGGRAMVRAMGAITGTEAAAAEIDAEIDLAMKGLRPLAVPPRTLYLIWRKPWMAAGLDTYIDSVLTQAGFDNLAKKLPGRYPEITSEEITNLAPEVVLLSSEPFPFKEKHIAEIQVLVPNAKVLLTDGEMFSWYGARMREAPAYLNDFLNNFK